MITIIERVECDGCGDLSEHSFLTWIGYDIPRSSVPNGWLLVNDHLYCSRCRKPIDMAIKKLKEKSTPTKG